MTSDELLKTMSQDQKNEPNWVHLMREHYQVTGFYRPQDLERILGNPRSSFEGKPCDDLLAASMIAAKAGQ
jgi:hypothetical protein